MVEYSPPRLPTEILLKILDLLELSDLLAYSDTCRTFQADLRSIDTPYVRNRVQKRVPWMDIGSGELQSWREAARLVLSRADSLMRPRNDKWTMFVHSAFHHYRPYHKTEYVECVDLSGPLPEDFQPMFETSHFRLPCFHQAHMDGSKLHFNKRQFDLKTFTCSEAAPEPAEEPSPKKRKVGRPPLKPKHPPPPEPPCELQIECPSGLKVNTIHLDSKIRCLGENERVLWLLELCPDPRARKQRPLPFRVQYLVDKPSCGRTADGKTLLFDRNHESTLLVPHDSNNDNILLSGNAGLIGFTSEIQTSSDLLVMYYDPSPKNRFVRQLMSVSCFFHGQKELDIVVRDGLLYFYKGDVLTPLWVDLEYHQLGYRISEPLFAKLGLEDLRSDDYVQKHGPMKVTKAACGVRPEMTAMRLVAREVEEGGRFPRRKLHYSNGGRYVASHLSAGRVVADLNTGTTYIVKDEGDNNKCMNFIFVGVSKDEKPVFYRWKRAFGLGFLDNLQRIQNRDPSSFYLKPNPDDTDLSEPIRADLPAPTPLLPFAPGTAAFSRLILGMDPHPPPLPPPPPTPIWKHDLVQDQKALQRDWQLKGDERALLEEGHDSKDKFENHQDSLGTIQVKKESDIEAMNKRKARTKLYKFDRPRWRI